ncbi:hypothetical protein [Streptomyces sp. NPDC088789]|uniref:hypothetical protein n=1 Tax=Streptomyces sp. NPDC088789 TaxID=3365899 RepID=UPI0037FEA9BE
MRMFRMSRLSAAAAIITPLALSVSLATPAHAALVCGTLPAHYVGSTYVDNDRFRNWEFESNGIININGLAIGRWSVNQQAVTVQSDYATYKSTFRGCDASLTKPGFINLYSNEAVQVGFPGVLTLSLVS